MSYHIERAGKCQDQVETDLERERHTTSAKKNKTILTGATVPSLPPHLSRKPSGNDNVILPAKGKMPSNSIRVSIRTPRNPGGNHNRLSKSLAF